VSFSSIVVAKAVRSYAEYDYDYAEYGVRGEILTIDPYVSGDNFVCQWVCVSLSYSNGYWVQSGYNKGVDSDYMLQWYVEKMDSAGYSITWKGYPYGNSVYVYYCKAMGNYWRIGVTNQWYEDINTNPYYPVRLLAASEATTLTIEIDGTHFNYLSYKMSNDWYLWDDHYVPDSPYTITETSDYEFYADGGG
jgi:hypothetical protein